MNSRYLAAAAVLLVIAGCATAPGLHEEADPIRMLPHDTNLAVSIPLVEHRTGMELVVPELFDGDLSTVLRRTSRITAARSVTRLQNGNRVSELHMVVEGSFTPTALRFGLPRRHGWSRERSNGIRYYRNPEMAVVLIEPGLLYAVISEEPEPQISAAMQRAVNPQPVDHPVPSLSSVSEARIWWRSAAAVQSTDSTVPPQIRSFLDTEGLFDYTMSSDGSLLMHGTLRPADEPAARALNVTLRFLLPQLIETVRRPAIERRGSVILIDDIELAPATVRQWALRLLEDFL